MSKKQSKKARKPTELNAANLAKVKAALAAEMQKVKKGDISTCQAIRNVAKRLDSVRPVEIEAVATKNFRINLWTVRTQIQVGRSQ